MKLSKSFSDFKKNHFRKKHQVIFFKKKCSNYKKIENIFNFILSKKNSFIFSLLKKAKLEVDTP